MMELTRSKNSETIPPFEVSVIVCHHKGDFIKKFVDSCFKSVGVTYEIIVITSDNNLALQGLSGCAVMNGPQYPAAKRNIGARIAKGEYLAFFDDDVEITPTCLANQKRVLDNDTYCGMTYGKLLKMDEPNRFDEAGGFLTWTGFIWSRAGQNDEDNGQFDKCSEILAGKSASCMIRKELFEKIGSFDEEFGILGEETDLSFRVWLEGKKVLFVPSSVGYHAFNTRFKPAKEYYTSKRVHFNGCRNYITMLIKNLGGKSLWKILPIHIVVWFIAGCAMICTLKVKQGMNVLKGLVYVLVNLKNILKKRERIQSKRVISDRELFKLIYKSPRPSYYIQRFWRYLTGNLHG